MDKMFSLSRKELLSSIGDISNEDLNKFFYLNLFDATSMFNEGIHFSEMVEYIEKNIHDFLLRNLKSFSKKFNKSRKKTRDDFIKSHIMSGLLFNELFVSYFRKNGITVTTRKDGVDFDNFVLNDEGEHKTCIEFKRILSTGSLLEYLETFSGKLCSCGKRHEDCRHVFACFIPVNEDEKILRINKLTIGYQYISKEILHHHVKDNTSIFFIPVDKNGYTHRDELVLDNFKRVLLENRCI